MDVKQIAQVLLNKTDLRQELCAQIPLIGALEMFVLLKDKRLTHAAIGKNGSYIGLEYEAIADGQLYPHVRQSMINSGLVKKHQIILLEVGGSKTPNEYEKVLISLGGAQISVKVFNPDYKPQS